jgi:trk system potassium uptake protein TrkH
VNLRPLSRILGRLLLLLAAAEAIPLVVCLLYGERGAALSFFATSLITAGCGVGLALYGKGAKGPRGELYRREGVLFVVAGWVFASAFGALPYLLTGALDSPVDALFESASGFTTTGASVFTDIESQGRGLLFWRSLTQWLGGMGIVVLFVALLPEVVPGARFLYALEVPGPTAETLHPRVRDTALVLWKIYLGMTIAQTVFLLACRMDLYDALTHTFATLSTGGFSPRNASAAAFGPAVQVVLVLFMVLSGANFSLYYELARSGVGRVLRDPEFQLYLAILGGTTAFVAWDLHAAGIEQSVPARLLHAAFQVSSMATTTGFASADFDTWPAVSRVLLVAVMFIGGCAGSTSGSMKVMRMVIGLKAAFREVRLLFSPSAVEAVVVGGKAVPNPVVRAVTGFFILFLSTWAFGTILLAFGDHPPLTAATASIAALGNVGPGLEGVGPTRSFADFAAWQKLILVLQMWVGRLEVYAIAALAMRRFWRP